MTVVAYWLSHEMRSHIAVWCICSGEVVWPDGRRYCGMFADGQFEGLGIYTQPSDDLGIEISEGLWKAGQLHGQARVRYVFLIYTVSKKKVSQNVFVLSSTKLRRF